MRDYLANEVRNVCLLGHRGAGKSSVVEAMLYFTKATERLGKTVDGTSAMDYDAEEVKRGMSVYTSIAPVEWKDCKINFVDTPGYLDFAGEAESGIAVSDNALIVVGARDGVESGTRKAWNVVSERKLPTIFFVNKIDEENADFDTAYNQIRDAFGKSVIPFEVPIVEGGKVVGSVNILKNKAWYYNDSKTPKDVPANMQDVVAAYMEQITEAVAMCDDELMEKFFEGEPFSDAEIAKGVRFGIRNGEIRPVYCGSATNMTGIERLMDLIVEYMPSYAEKGTVEAVDANDEPVLLETSENEAATAFVFKTIVDPFAGRISFIKVMTGVISMDSQLVNVQKDKVEKMNQAYIIKGKHQVAVGKLFTGDIGAVIKLQYTETNDTLAQKGTNVRYPAISFPRGMLGMAVWPKTRNDEDKLSSGLQRIQEEDKSCFIENNRETKETVIYGLGDQHIDVIRNKLKTKYKVEVELTKPKVQYRETIRSKVQAEGKHKKQSGGAGQYGHVKIEFEPCESEEMVFEERVFGGAVPRQYFPAVEAGLRECMDKGVLAGYKVVGVKATLYDGSYHEVDSKEIAFKMAAHLAYKAGMPKAKPVLLEPIVSVEVTVPDEYTGTIIGDLTKRRGTIMGQDMVGDNQVIQAEVPMAEMMVYATELRSMTQGIGTYTQKFERYDVAPTNVADKVIAQAAKEKDEE
ncbi:MAG: elongation factor G [Erysipelotrichaceae bacterium]|nr:elongation factor G [Erysipelotrichaceae bacterium]